MSPFLGGSGYPRCKNTGDVPAKLMEDLGLNGNAADKSGEPHKLPQPLPEEHEDAA